MKHEFTTFFQLDTDELAELEIGAASAGKAEQLMKMSGQENTVVLNTFYPLTDEESGAGSAVLTEVRDISGRLETFLGTKKYELVTDAPKGIITEQFKVYDGGTVTLPHFISHIAKGCFARFGLPAKIVLPQLLRVIGDLAFYSCKGLKFMEVPDGVTRIGAMAFAQCSRLVRLELPDSVCEIGQGAFEECENLKVIHIPKNIKEIGEGTFSGCKSLIEADIPEGTELVDNRAFCFCTNLRKVSLPTGVKRIGKQAFGLCYRLENIVIPAGTEELDSYAFGHCKRLKSVVLPNSLRRVGDHAFLHCPEMKSVIIPPCVTEIGEMAFGYYMSKKGEQKTEDFVIFCSGGSAGESYARENGFRCELV